MLSSGDFDYILSSFFSNEILESFQGNLNI